MNRTKNIARKTVTRVKQAKPSTFPRTHTPFYKASAVIIGLLGVAVYVMAKLSV